MRTKEQVQRARDLTEKFLRVTANPQHGIVISATAIALNWVLEIEGPNGGDGLTEMLDAMERRESAGRN